MPTYTSPVSVSEFQLYINDQSADPTTLSFFQSLLDTSTERIYTYLDLDFTPSAAKTEMFIGAGGDYLRLHQPAGSLTAWVAVDDQGIVTPQDISPLHLFDGGRVVVCANGVFAANLEHHISYTLPATLTCPETVRHVIKEVAAIMLRESKQGAGTLGEQLDLWRDNVSMTRQVYLELDDRHRTMLSPYKRYAQ